MKKIKILLLLISISIAPIFAAVDNYSTIINHDGETTHLSVYFIDLDVPETSKHKSGDSTLIIAPTGEAMLIDCGNPYSYDDVRTLLEDLGIEELKYVMISHPHIDHLGSFPMIADNFKVDKVIRSKLEYNSSSYYRAFLASIDEHKIPVDYVVDGDSYNLGPDVVFNILAPIDPIIYPKKYPDNSTQFINDESIAVQFHYGQSTALFCGDLYRQGEKAVLKRHGDILKSDLAKANHHGNDTSNQLKWVKTVLPQVVVAMNDLMGSNSVYKSYKKRGATFYHTFYNGNIKVQLDKNHGIKVTPQFESWVEKE